MKKYTSEVRRTMIHKNKLHIICSLSFCFIIAYISILYFSEAPIGVKQKYNKCSNQITLICEYLNNPQYKQYDIIRIEIYDSINKIECSEKNGVDDGFTNTSYTITDNNLLKCIETLKKQGFVRILKEYNYLCFQTKGSFNTSVGLLYSPYEEPDLSEINAKKIITKKINDLGWYYNKTIYD